MDIDDGDSMLTVRVSIFLALRQTTYLLNLHVKLDSKQSHIACASAKPKVTVDPTQGRKPAVNVRGQNWREAPIIFSAPPPKKRVLGTLQENAL